MAGTRWAIEETVQTAKGEVGLDHYQVRRYDSSTTHHPGHTRPRTPHRHQRGPKGGSANGRGPHPADRPRGPAPRTTDLAQPTQVIRVLNLVTLSTPSRAGTISLHDPRCLNISAALILMGFRHETDVHHGPHGGERVLRTSRSQLELLVDSPIVGNTGARSDDNLATRVGAWLSGRAPVCVPTVGQADGEEHGGRACPGQIADVPVVARFMNTHLNRRVPASRWARPSPCPGRSRPPTTVTSSGRTAAWSVPTSPTTPSDRSTVSLSSSATSGRGASLTGHRHQGIRLLTRLLGQKGYHFTDFSPSGNVVPLNRRLKFTDLDTTTTLVPNVPLPRRRGDMRVTARPDALLTRSLAELALYRNHQHAAAAKHYS